MTETELNEKIIGLKKNIRTDREQYKKTWGKIRYWERRVRSLETVLDSVTLIPQLFGEIGSKKIWHYWLQRFRNEGYTILWGEDRYWLAIPERFTPVEAERFQSFSKIGSPFSEEKVLLLLEAVRYSDFGGTISPRELLETMEELEDRPPHYKASPKFANSLELIRRMNWGDPDSPIEPELLLECEIGSLVSYLKMDWKRGTELLSACQMRLASGKKQLLYKQDRLHSLMSQWLEYRPLSEAWAYWVKRAENEFTVHYEEPGKLILRELDQFQIEEELRDWTIGRAEYPPEAETIRALIAAVKEVGL